MTLNRRGTATGADMDLQPPPSRQKSASSGRLSGCLVPIPRRCARLPPRRRPRLTCPARPARACTCCVRAHLRHDRRQGRSTSRPDGLRRTNGPSRPVSACTCRNRGRPESLGPTCWLVSQWTFLLAPSRHSVEPVCCILRGQHRLLWPPTSDEALESLPRSQYDSERRTSVPPTVRSSAESVVSAGPVTLDQHACLLQIRTARVRRTCERGPICKICRLDRSIADSPIVGSLGGQTPAT